jgi:predicted CxxxxCH...CXXCH cytochrome family protein
MRAHRLAAYGLVLLAACDKGRDLTLCASIGGQAADCDASTGYHPAGWADTKNQSSPSFHKNVLRATGDKLSVCQTCHGTDFGGGAVGVSCLTAGCHTKPGGPEFCGTCHGGPGGPLPSTGAHLLHATFCNDCHDVPKTFAQPDHITGTPRVAFSGLATSGGKTPTFDPTAKSCSNVYCHVSQTPVWALPPAVIACNSCHETPPASHQAWSRVAMPPAGATPQQVAAVCAKCHPVPTPGATPALGDTHVNGQVDFQPTIACNTCHGHDATGAPPVALDGATDPSDHGVGQHQAHLDETLAGRIGHVVACPTCHTVPASVTQPGHLDHPLPAIVSLPQGGTYDPAKQGCAVWCHSFPNNQAAIAPVWNDVSGRIVAPNCTGCHGFPPVLRRDGTPHTQAPAQLSACLLCHPFSPTTHVDGIVELIP